MSDNWTPPPSEQYPAPTPQPQRSRKKGWSPLTLVLVLSGAFFVVFLVISGVLFLARSPSGESSRPAGAALFKGRGSVAVVEVLGAIMDSKKTLRKLERAEEDPDVKAVVI